MIRRNFLLMMAQVLVGGGLLAAFSAPLWSGQKDKGKDDD